ncbi:hypothetical protein C2G38_2118586 [Gigaspora rosea]|uniref:Uncharacterized protein n=1 Tax=Gigaspora rosea TaxID=44941 RepID=A0A397U6L4_9GLOM|nr:hypothetical protein C2G38_2118586 [Gigaspora rosea]
MLLKPCPHITGRKGSKNESSVKLHKPTRNQKYVIKKKPWNTFNVQITFNKTFQHSFQ